MVADPTHTYRLRAVQVLVPVPVRERLQLLEEQDGRVTAQPAGFIISEMTYIE